MNNKTTADYSVANAPNIHAEHDRTGANRPQSPQTRRVSRSSLLTKLRQQLLLEIDHRQLGLSNEDTLSHFVDDFVERQLAPFGETLTEDDRESIHGDLWGVAVGSGPLARLMIDPSVTDILVNSYDDIYVERLGRLEPTDIRFRSEQHLRRTIEEIASRVGRRIGPTSPMVDARLPDGSRVNATVPPVSVDGPTLSIRRFGFHHLRAKELLQKGMFSPQMLMFFHAAVRGKKSILVSGGTGTGKSTLLGAISEAIPVTERIVTIEDDVELSLDQDHVVRLESQPPDARGQGEISTRSLVKNSLRMRPDRIIVGEVRGAEALDMLQALNTGHDGSMTTIHANSPRDALSRLETMVLMAGIDLPSRGIREQIVSAIDLIIHLRRYEDGVRRVESVTELVGMEDITPQMQEIYRFDRSKTPGSQGFGQFHATGIVPRMVEDLRQKELMVPTDLFRTK
jgi:pilus assembly protein CpaF